MEVSEMRNLKADEIQCRAQIVKQNGFSLLLYKNARCDMNILDEEFGAMNWKDSYQEINGNLFCTISIWDEEKKQWISKQDAGSASNMEAKKGHASDAFKRAGFRWGIGRELYTAPFIWINAKSGETYKRKRDNKWALKSSTEFFVQDIKTEDGTIQDLVIVDKNLDVRWRMGKGSVDNDKEWLDETDKERWMKAEKWVKKGNNPHKLRNKYKVSNDNMEYFENIYRKAGH
jgi:hypothetical protein